MPAKAKAEVTEVVETLEEGLTVDSELSEMEISNYQTIDLSQLDFEMSSPCNQLFKALALANKAIGPVTAMTGRNSRFKSESNKWEGTPYSTLDDVLRATKVKLADQGLSLIMPPTGGSKTGGYFIQCLLVHSSGQYVKARYQLPVGGNAESQLISSANTYGKRIMVLGILNMAPGDAEDDDGNLASPNNVPSSKEETSSPAPPPAQASQQQPPPAQGGASEFNKLKSDFENAQDQAAFDKACASILTSTLSEEERQSLRQIGREVMNNNGFVGKSGSQKKVAKARTKEEQSA